MNTVIKAQDRRRIISIDVNYLSGVGRENVVNRLMSTEGAAYVCAANVHMCMEAFDDPAFRDVVNKADLVIPDGRPLVWAQRLLGADHAMQLRGMDLMLKLCESASRSGTAVGFYGGSEAVLARLIAVLTAQFPGLNVALEIAPPFRQPTADEDRHYCEQINASGVRILFVGLGCPKQERWMAEHRDRLHCVMLGVGAAFDFIAGNKRHAPRWLQKAGLEWLFRLVSEPRRLWRRYLIQNPRFIWYFIGQLATGKRAKSKEENI